VMKKNTRSEGRREMSSWLGFRVYVCLGERICLCFVRAVAQGSVGA
jgi:hypothetical protein